jgi:diguanylate cyclase (GGDEF)-like protein
MGEIASDGDVAKHLLAFAEATSDLVGVVDDESRVQYLNEAARKRLGLGDAADLTTADVLPPQAFVQYYDEIRPELLRSGTWHGEISLLSGTGDVVPVVMTVVARLGPGGEVMGLVTQGREVDDPAETRSSMRVYDELTGLPGRTILDDRIRVALSRAARNNHQIALVVVDVDSLKDINDSFGHAVGDEALRRLAHALSGSIRASDTVARLGGDEFVVLLDGLAEADVASQFADRLRDAVCRVTIETEAGAFVVTASFGLAIGTADDAPAALLQRADNAMYRAKGVGAGRVAVFDDGADVSSGTLADDLAVAVSHGLIRPHVQPIVDLHRGVLAGYQGLARWEHPQRGLLDAEQFVDAVANTPILPVVDLAVLRRTAAAAARAARGGAQVRAYGHLSRRLMGDAHLARFLTEIVDDLGIAPSDLCVEIAHTLIARPSRRIDGALRDLRDIGVRTVLSAVDGECEVNQIVDYGFEELRLARGLVRDSARDPKRRRVAHGTIALARALGLTVIAVGIETDDERVDMRDAGCDFGQGYLLGAVQPAGLTD